MIGSMLAAYRPALYALAALLAFAAGWVSQGWRLDARLSAQSALHAQSVGDLTQSALAASKAQHDARTALERQLSALDQQHYQELTHAQSVTDALSADLAAQRKRLSVRVSGSSCSGVSASTGTASVGDGVERADLHPATAASVVAIAGEADQCAIKLTALQEWVKQVRR